MFVGFDTEFSFSRTHRLHGKLRGDLTTFHPVSACLSFENGQEERFTGEWGQMEEFFNDDRYIFVSHGCHAEALFCERVGLEFPRRWRDTQLMALLILHAQCFRLPGGAYAHSSLADMAERYGVAPLWTEDKDDIRESLMLGTRPSRYGIERVLRYCMEDARLVRQLAIPLQPRCSVFAAQTPNAT